MDENEEGNVPASLRHRIYYAARDGLAITLFALLSQQKDHLKSLLDEVYEDENNQSCTPLMIAAKHGHEMAVKTLLNNFKPNLEVEGVIKLTNLVVENATALWVAAAAGYLPIVKLLIHAGAQVNHGTRSNSTPLRAACFDGRLDIVKYLAEHGGDINVPNKYNNNSLMISAYKGHTDIVSYLLEKGCDPDARANCGATAMHFAAECGHLDVIKELLLYGASLLNNENGMSQLAAAAERTKADVVEFLLTRPEVGKLEKIEALELLGASFANDKDSYSLEKAYHYLHQAMELRFSDVDDIIHKPVCNAIPAYENWVESRNLEELQRIENNANALHMESLAIRERILGRQNPELPHPIVFRGAVFADSARFERCVELWLHALTLRKETKGLHPKDLLRFAQVFSQMVHLGVDLKFSHVEQVLAAAVNELAYCQQKLERSESNEDLRSVWGDLESEMSTVLYILVIVIHLMKRNDRDVENRNIYQLVCQLNRIKLRTRDQETLLHLCVNFETIVDDFHTSDVCKFPNADVAKLLIDCGADVDAMDTRRNTPLHIIVSYKKPVSDFITLHSIIMCLIKAGAHMDPVNCKGETPLEAATTGVAEIILQSQGHINLKCIAAKVVKNCELTYQGQVPKVLENFIELHGRQG